MKTTKKQTAKLTPSEVKALELASLSLENHAEEGDGGAFPDLMKKYRLAAKTMRKLITRLA